LWFLVNPLTAALAALALGLYVLAYTPLKRVTSRALLVGAIPGAMPPLLGWTAATGSIDWPGLALFGVLFFWQLPHFVAIATFRADEYARAGIIVLPAERGDRTARIHAVIYLCLLVSVSLALVPLGVCGSLYCATALLLGAIFLAAGVRGLSPATEKPAAAHRWARQLFVVSLIYLPLLMGAIMVGV
jgi:protoheme IX farnesyltransferase